MTPAGLIEEFAAETESRRQREAVVAAREEASSAAKRTQQDREARTEARKIAMKATAQMIGRVIFPARWDVDLSEAAGVRCSAVVEGRVGIDVVVNVHGFGVPVEAIIVSNAETGEATTWKGSVRHDLPVSKQPISPGREWFRRALTEVGVIA